MPPRFTTRLPGVVSHVPQLAVSLSSTNEEENVLRKPCPPFRAMRADAAVSYCQCCVAGEGAVSAEEAAAALELLALAEAEAAAEEAAIVDETQPEGAPHPPPLSAPLRAAE